MVLGDLGQRLGIFSLVFIFPLMAHILRSEYAEAFVPKQSSARAAELNLEPSVLERIRVVFSRVHDLWDSLQTNLVMN